jgi:hypothetical protein
MGEKNSSRSLYFLSKKPSFSLEGVKTLCFQAVVAKTMGDSTQGSLCWFEIVDFLAGHAEGQEFILCI